MDNSQLRIEYKDVEVNSRTFRIKKFNALTGCFILVKVVGILTPLFSSFKNIKNFDDFELENINFTEVSASLTNLSENDFTYVQKQCLKVCSEVLPGNTAPVLDQNDNFGVIGLETDTMTVLALTVHALMFNVSGFFGEGLLGSFKEKLTLFQQGAKT